MNIEYKAHKRHGKGKITRGEDPNARGFGGMGVKGAWILPQPIAAPPRNDEHAPMQFDGRERHTPHTNLVPHCTLRTTSWSTHRDHHLSPQHPPELREAKEANREPPRIHTTSQRKAHTTYPSFSPTDGINPQHHTTLLLTSHRRQKIAH
jgi:hypothetical protein